MTGTATTRMIAAYEQGAAPSSYFTRMFQSPARNFHNSQSVQIDIQRNDEDVAIVITDITTGTRLNSDDIYTNKEFVPPIYNEEFPINVNTLLTRIPGRNPFESPQFQRDATTRFFRGMRKVEAKIRRAIELQAAQVLQIGVVTLIDSAGNTLYTIDYKPKATHFPTASPLWDGVSPTIELDLESLCDVIRNDGQSDPDMTIWGSKAFYYAMNDTSFKAKFEPRRADTGRIVPMEIRDSGAQYRGVIDIGNYQLDVYTYNGKYKHPSTGAVTNFMDTKKVIVRASNGRLDATFGALPIVVPPEQRLLPFLPPRLRGVGRGVDMTTNAWVNDKGTTFAGSVGTRPLLIPTAIDTYGCITATS